jgi:hypothetical protein
MAENLHTFYGMTIARIRDRGTKHHPTIGWRLVGEWIDTEYITYD